MNFVQICFSFKGRISRKTFWLMQLLVGAILFIVNIVDPNALDADSPEVSPYIITLLVIAWVQLALAAKRWHDRDKSALWILINLVPIIGTIWSFVELGFFKGTTGKNRFGLDPLQIR